MFKSPTATRLIYSFVSFFLFFFSFCYELSAQVAIYTADSKTGATATVHSLTSVPVGALLVLTTTSASNTLNCTVSSSPSLTWTRRIEATAASSGDAEIYTAIFPAGGTISVTSNWGTWQQASTCFVVTGQESTLAGASASGISQQFPSVSITTTRANSILFCATSDWNGVDGVSRAYRNAPIERLYFPSPIPNTVTHYHYTKSMPTVGNTLMGLTAPNMNNGAGTAVLEIRSSATDPVSPTVSITSPSAGNVSGTINVNATASDNVGVVGVQFLLDGANLGAEDLTAAYSVSWNTTTATNGTHTLTARARDAAGNTTTSAGVVVTVNNPDTQAPTVSITAPAAGNVSGTINVNANASDNVGVVGVQFLLDGANLGAEDLTAAYSVSWNTTTATNGTHTLTARARDAAGNTTTSAGVVVTVNNTDTQAPTVSITAPAAGNVSGTINVNANASDNVGVVGVQFLLDGANLGAEDLTSAYSVSWNTTTATNGTHTLTARARDAAGNTTTSAGVVVTVNNPDTQAPTVSITAPAAGNVSVTINVDANASDNVGVVGVQFLLDGANLGTEDLTSAYSVSWNTTTATNGTHTLTARARDAAGNTTTSAGVVVTVNNPDTQAPTAPTNLAAPAVGATQISLTWTAATDNVGVTGYEVYEGSNLKTTTANTSYTITGLNASTQYSIYVRAKDAAGNGTNSGTIIKTTLSADFWSVIGNAGTDPASYFVGTTDNQPLVLKANTGEARLTTAGNFGIGISSPTYKLDVNGNARITNDAVIKGLTIGRGSGITDYNTALGYLALNSNTTGYINTAVGDRALASNTTGSYNTAVGANSLLGNTEGTGNTGLGYRTLENNTIGGSNTAIGHNALPTNTTGSYNSALGVNALSNNTTGAANTALGNAALGANTIASNNTGVGHWTLFSNTIGNNNNAYGSLTMLSNSSGSGNAAYGTQTLYFNTSGSNNVAFGSAALLQNSSGNNNTAIGDGAGSSLIIGNNNIFIGSAVQPNISNTGSNQLNIGNWIYGDNGNVGVGVSTPSAKFHSNGSVRLQGLSTNNSLTNILAADGNGNLSWRDAATLGGGTSGWSLTGNAGTNPATNFIGTTDAQPVVFKVANAEAMRINTDRSVNFNTPDGVPLVATFSSDNMYGTWINVNNHNVNSYYAPGSGIRLALDGTPKTQIFHNDNAFSHGGSFDVLSGNAEMLSRTGDVYLSTVNFMSNGLIVKNTTGYVGIGTYAPSSQLHTTGSVRFQGLSANNSLTNILASDANGNLSWRDASTLGSGGSSNWTLSGNNISNSNSGVVLIGRSTVPATTPADASIKLAVEGSIYSKKVKVTPDGWADYVFYPQYKLPTLKEVEAFIEKNQHLPDVPSAGEIEKKGLDLGENQAILLKKIEELTLYLIDINKKVDKLAEENAALKKRLDAVNK